MMKHNLAASHSTTRFRALPCFISAVFMFMIVAASAAATSAGNVTGLTLTTNSPSGNLTASFSLSGGGSVEVTPFAADVVRVDYHWVGPF